MYQRAMTFRLDGVGWFHVVIGEARWDVYEVAGVSLSLSECTSGVTFSRRVGHGEYDAQGPRLDESYMDPKGQTDPEAVRSLMWAEAVHRSYIDPKGGGR